MMLSYHLGSKFIIIICDSVNFAFLYFHKKIGKDIVKNIKGQIRYNFRF